MDNTITPEIEFKSRHKSIAHELGRIELPKSIGTETCMKVGASLGITGTTVLNYLKGNIKDGYLAEAIYKEFKILKLIKRQTKS